ncbi:MAG: ATP-binding cassette domain-containing protein [Caldicoprobacterales bacterium]|jgi:peptide/nickel transport system ATP-binding protein
MQLEANNIYFRYTAKTPFILQDVSFSVREGERVGVVSPSGYGKTTFVKILAGHEQPTKGQVLLDGKPLAPKGALPVQLISQHPENAVNPRWKMQKVLEEAGQLRPEVLTAMGIEPEWLTRYPRELSGGELQRFCVARALCADTRFLIADEISTMLDAITQAQIWRYLLSEVDRRGIGLVVVTHNPALAGRICTRVVDLRDINHIEREQEKYMT